jgi:aryl-alcohol dehydrogenase-like predicted oxidoreductase
VNYRNLGNSGLKVSEISLGSWTTYGGSVDDAEAIRIVHRAFELGINLFDTADVYVRGAAEVLLGRALTELPREQIVIATKCMGRVWDGPLGAGLSRKHMFDALHQSLRRLCVDYVDLYQLHAPDASTPIEETLRALDDMVTSGKVRYVGFSNFDKEPKLAARTVEYQKAHDYDAFISSQPRWNLVDRHVEKEHVAFCKANGIGMIVYSPLAQGVLTNKYAGGARPETSRANTKFAFFLTAEGALTDENVAAAERFAKWVKSKGLPGPAPVALAWVLSRPQVSSVITGATRVAQLEENLTALELKLTAADFAGAEAAIAGVGSRNGGRTRGAVASGKAARAAKSGKPVRVAKSGRTRRT